MLHIDKVIDLDMNQLTYKNGNKHKKLNHNLSSTYYS